jgi:hypothetical protein
MKMPRENDFSWIYSEKILGLVKVKCKFTCFSVVAIFIDLNTTLPKFSSMKLLFVRLLAGMLNTKPT